MPPKAKATSTVYIVFHENAIDSVFATDEAATERAEAAKVEGLNNVKVETRNVVGGSITVTEIEKSKAAPKSKAKAEPKEKSEPKENSEPKAKTKAAPKKEPKSKAKADDQDEDELEKPEAAAPKANTAAKKTKPPAEQRATNKSKAADKKPEDENLPANVKALLEGSGSQLQGMTIVVTGVPPNLGRKNVDKLVQNYGAKLGKTISKNTSLVVIGGDAGPKKLEQIEELGIDTMDDMQFVAMLEKGSGPVAGGDGAADEDEDDEEVEEEEPRPKKRSRKQK